MALIDRYRFPVVNISQFYPRPGTPAAKMKRIKTQDVKNRSRRLTTLFESFTPYAEFPRQILKVWFGNEISEDGAHSVGHSKGYVKVLVPLDQNLPGTVAYVLIESAKRFHIEGQIIHGHVEKLPPSGSHPISSSIDSKKGRTSAFSFKDLSGFAICSVIAIAAILSISVLSKSKKFSFSRILRK